MRRMIPDNKWKEVKNVTEPLSFDSANRVLTVDSDLQMTGDILVADEDQQSVKKIYYHPINMYDGTKKNAFIFVILNNSSAPIDTFAKLKAWANSISGAVIMNGNGIMKNPNTNTFNNVYALYKTPTETWTVCFSTSSGYETVTNQNIEDYFATIEDNVNSIN